MPLDTHTNKSAMPKPRLAYVLWDFPALSQTFVMNELRWLIRHEYDVRVYYAVKADTPATLDFPVTSHQVDDSAKLAELLQRHKRTAVHSFFTYPAATCLAWPASRSAKIPFTFGAHAVDIFHYKNDQRNEVYAMSRDPRCLRVLVPGAFHHTYLLERGVPWEKLSICPQAVDLSEFRASRVVDVEEKNGPTKVITVARFVEKKGIANLILAAKELGDLPIVIEIHGYGPLEDEYRALIEKKGISNVQILPPIQNRSEYVRIMSSANLFIAPSVRASNGDMDGIPTVLMEAMSLGIPVAASRVSSIPDLVVDGLTGLLMTPGDPEDIARTIRRFRAMPAKTVQTMTEKAATHAFALSSIEGTMETLTSAWASQPLRVF